MKKLNELPGWFLIVLIPLLWVIMILKVLAFVPLWIIGYCNTKLDKLSF